MLKSIFYATALLMLTALTPAQAASSPSGSVAALADAIRSDDAEAARHYLTKSSLSLYDRFASYGLLACLPQDVAYLSQEKAGNVSVVKALLTGSDGVKQVANLTFQREEKEWKLDLPGSLRRGLGAKWENKVNVMEQLYLMLRQQMGGKLDCKAIQALAKP